MNEHPELLGWAGFLTTLAGAAAISLPGNPNSLIVHAGFIVTGAGVAVTLIYGARRFSQARAGKRARR